MITPFYKNIIKEKLQKTGIVFTVDYNRGKVKVEILENNIGFINPSKGFYKEYYLKAGGFFNSKNSLNDPYFYVENNVEKNNKVLNENSLFFSFAVCPALKELKIYSNIIFHLQEWQTAVISLTSKEAMLDGIIESAACVQTMHNPYDSFFLWKDIYKISRRINQDSIRKIESFYKKKLTGLTAYQLGLNLTDAPVTTMSRNFAKELTTDPLQAKHFTPHLQKIFKTGSVYGINNGLFESYPEEYKFYEKLSIEEIKRIKSKKRKDLLKIIDVYDNDKIIGKLTYKNSSI